MLSWSIPFSTATLPTPPLFIIVPFVNGERDRKREREADTPERSSWPEFWQLPVSA
jgi:hypothetical protein